MARAFIPHVVTEDSALGGSFLERSLRFNDADSAYLTRTPSSAGDRRTWTWSGWVKRANAETNMNLFSVRESASVRTIIRITDGLDFLDDDINFRLKTNQVFRDSTAWYHFVIVSNTTDSTSSNRLKVYVNGEQITSFSTSTYPSQNYEGQINNTYAHALGREGAQDNDYLEGYMAEVNFVDGQAYDPSYFGYTEFQTGIWKPKRYTGTYGTNGFYLNFANNDLVTHFTDTSSSARTVTRNGNVIHKSDQTKNGATSIYFDGSGDSLTVPDSSDFHVAGNDFTIEAYIRRTSQGNDEWFFVQSEGTTSNTSIGLHIGSSSSGYANKPSLRYTVGGSGNELTGTTALAANTWYHIAGVRDGNTLRIYVNGQQENSTSFSGTITDASTAVIMGAVNSAGSAGLTGYMDQIRWSNSCRYTGGSTFTPPTTQFTADSNTMLLVQSNVTGDLGSDSSGNGNNFTPNNFTVSDSMIDTPTNNFPMMFSDISSPSLPATITEAGLRVQGPTSHSDRYERTIGGMPNSGKYYVEVKCVHVGARGTVGMYDAHERGGSTDGGTSNWFTFGNHNGGYNTSWTRPNYSQFGTFQTGEYMTIALDMDNGKIWLNRNAAIDTTAAPRITDVNTSNPDRHYTWFYRETSSDRSTSEFNFGQQPYNFTPPDGFKPLSTNNFPTQQTPHVISPKKHFDTLLYSGNDGTQSINGLEFSPDFVWIKMRSHSGDNHHLYDSVRGPAKTLFSNTNAAEQTSDTDRLTSFNSNGFTLGNNYRVNGSGRTFVAWCWKAGGGVATNTNGNITSSVSVNEEAGFSIVSYTGNGSNGQTVGHGLSQAPKWIMLKARDATQNWRVWHHSLAADGSKRLILDQTNISEDAAFLNDTAPTSTVFTLGNADDAWNANSAKFIAYCWHEVPGFSKFGVYKGNASSDGPYIHLGFRPAWIMIKNISNSTNRHWCIIDATRYTFNKSSSAEVLFADDSQAESAANNNYGQFGSKAAIDILSNGFKIREPDTSGVYTQLNRDNTDLVYMAFADQPGSTAYDTETNAR